MKLLEEFELEVEGMKHVFRFKKMSPAKMIALGYQMKLSDVERTETLSKEVLENTEFKTETEWLPVKEKDKEVYWPMSLENDYLACKNLVDLFILEVLLPVFQPSRESKKEQK